MGKLITGIALVAVVIGGWWWMNRAQDEEMTMPTGQNEQTQQEETDNTQTEYPAVADVEDGVAGVWQSTSDEQFTREFEADGSVTDRYENDEDATAVGTWEVFTDISTQPVALPSIDGATYLRIRFNEETLYYTVPEITTDSLTLIYLDGGALSFTRVE